MPQETPLRGLRILIAEDNVFAALEIEQTLRDLSCTPVGPASSIEQALALLSHEQLDGALLDVNLRGELCFPVADELERRGVPVVFATGYDDDGIIPKRFQDRPRLRKPFMSNELQRTMIKAFVHG